MRSVPTRTTIDGRPVWLFPTGRTIPVVAGGADDGDAGGDADEGAPPGADGSSSPPPTSGGDDDLGELPDQAVFDRGYVEKIRAQAAKYRTERNEAAEKLTRYDEAFGVYSDEDQQVWIDMAQSWVNDPTKAATMMQNIAKSVLGEPESAEAAQAEQDVIDEAIDDFDGDREALTPEKVQEIIENSLAAREQAAREQAEIANIRQEVRDGGYDPDSREGFMVLWTAHHETGGDIAKAIESIKSRDKEVVDRFIKEHSGKGGPTTPGRGVVASGEQTINTLEDSKKAADAFIRSQIGASSGSAS